MPPSSPPDGSLLSGVFGRGRGAAAGGARAGHHGQLVTQAIAVLATGVFAAVVTAVIHNVIDLIIGLRVPEQEEVLGLDTTQHGELAYQL